MRSILTFKEEDELQAASGIYAAPFMKQVLKQVSLFYFSLISLFAMLFSPELEMQFIGLYLHTHTHTHTHTHSHAHSFTHTHTFSTLSFPQRCVKSSETELQGHVCCAYTCVKLPSGVTREARCSKLRWNNSSQQEESCPCFSRFCARSSPWRSKWVTPRRERGLCGWGSRRYS